MALLVRTTAVVLMFVSVGECNLFNFLMGPQATPYSSGSLLDSFASPVPGSSFNTISGGPSGGSNLPPPEPPQVLRNALGPAPPLNIAPPPEAAQPASPVNKFMNMVNGFGAGGGGQGPPPPAANAGPAPTGQVPRQNPGQMLPVAGKLKQVVTKWATQLGHKAWYEAHGCVDPANALHGKHGRLAGMAMMMGCSNVDSKQYCELAQMAHGGSQAARSRMLMELMMPKHMLAQFEQCLTPSTLMSSVTGMLGGGGGYNPYHQSSYHHNPYGLSPPPGAAAFSPRTDCSGISPMLMMGSMGGGEGMLGPEAMENIGRMRNRYLKMQCQENLIMGSLPYRLCCPGKVKPPTMQEAMMVRSMGGA